MELEKNVNQLLTNLHLKKNVRNLVEKIHIHRKSDLPNVLIFSTPRSGSTWLFDLIGLNPGFKTINEPLHKRSLFQNYVEHPRWRYTCLSQSEKALLKQYFDDSFTHKMSNYPISKKQHRWITNRALIKCLRAPGLLEWFIEAFDCHVIFLLRHPIPVCLSRLRNEWNWPSMDKAEDVYAMFYKCQYYQKHILTENIKVLIQKKVARGNEFDKHLIMWSLENIKALKKIRKLSKNPRFVLLTYEELAMKTEKVIDHLAEMLNLPAINKMKRSIETPSGSSKHSLSKTKSAISDGQKKYLIEKWKNKISKQQEAAVSEILSAFNIDIYNGSSVLPKKSYTNFL